MKKTIIYGLCLVLALLGSGCSDDEDTPVDTALLTGTWQCVSEYDSEDDEWFDLDYPSYLVINEDHYGYKGLYSPSDRNEYDRLTWSCAGNRFTLHYDGEEAADILVIEKLTDEELVWRMDCYEEGYHWVEKERYRRYHP